MHTLARRAAATIAILLLPACNSTPPTTNAPPAAPTPSTLTRAGDTITAIIPPLMQRHAIPGLAVGIVHADHVSIRCFGTTGHKHTTPVTPDTLFEVGSISKAFTALLGAHLAHAGHFNLNDPISTHLPTLAGSPIGQATMLQFGTYTPGGLPLQVPATTTNNSLLTDLALLSPPFPPGTHRQYSNLSIGLFGRAAATAARTDFTHAMSTTILPQLQMHDTFINVPPAAQPRYAWGHDANLKTVRVNPGVLDAEAYGIKTTAVDMCRFIKAQFNAEPSHPLAPAIASTHQPRYSVGPMTQALGWECYPYPTPLNELLEGNAPKIIFESQPVEPTRTLPADLLYNKTGSTGGFAAYVLFVPTKRLGVVILANKGYPIADRVTAAHAILQALDPSTP